MTKQQITAAAQQDSDAMKALIESLRTGTEDNAIHLIESLIAAARRDAADDIHIDLKREGMTDAAQLVKNEYL